ncbi:Gp138 family membrane-puncturing spike protein [Escherichia coli]
MKAGDECLVIFADRCIDFWWQNGGYRSLSMTERTIYRMRSVSSGRSLRRRKSTEQGTSGAQLRLMTALRLAKWPQAIISRSNSRRVDGDSRRKEQCITSPTITLNGNVTRKRESLSGDGRKRRHRDDARPCHGD